MWIELFTLDPNIGLKMSVIMGYEPPIYNFFVLVNRSLTSYAWIFPTKFATNNRSDMFFQDESLKHRITRDSS
jgi:hypothetical protein